MTGYPNREHRNASLAAHRRAIAALHELEAAARTLAHRLSDSGTYYVDASSASGLHEQAAKVTANFAVLETLRDVREWDAADKAQAAAEEEERLSRESKSVQDFVRDRQSARAARELAKDPGLAAEEPELCMRCGIASTVDAPLQYSGVPGGWLCIDTRNCNKRREVNGGRVVPQAVADARETKAWRDGYESTARLIGSAGCTSRCDHANGIHAPARYDGLCHELAFSGDCSLARDHSGKHDWER